MQMWSYSGDMLRSAGMLAPGYGNFPPAPGNPGEFGGLMGGDVFVGFRYLGGHPAGPTYSILAMIGHGGKFVDLYNYGPDLVGGNPWSQYQAIYKPIADATRLIGQAEKLLYPGRPRRGNVAIYFPGISNLWDDQNSASRCLYLSEVQFLHYALIHAGYTVDFVDDYYVASGALQQRGYTTLYVTGPNVANDKNMIPQPPSSPSNSPIPSPQDQIQSWVNNGGVLAVTPGGGVADEYNTPTTTFDIILGLQSTRKDPRPFSTFNDTFHSFDLADTITGTDSRFGSEIMDISYPVDYSLTPTTATICATFSNAKPAITINSYGKGYGITYAFFPGFHYQQSANWDTNAEIEPSQRTGLPYGWGKVQRDIIVAPARIANTPKPITLNQGMVEACLLESEEGIAIVLLNWSGMPGAISNLTMTINDSTTPIPVGSRISSAQDSTVTPNVTSSQPPFNIGLSVLEYVDVIMIDYRP